MDRLTHRDDQGMARIGFGGLVPTAYESKAAIDRLAAYEDAMPLERVQALAQADQDGRLVVANVSGRCGSCAHYRRIEGTARGACVKHPYGKDLICDPKIPYWVVGRRSPKCKLYEEAN